MKTKTEMLENGNLKVTVPIDLRVRNGGKTLAVDGEAPEDTGRKAFLLAVARGRAWQRLVDEGRVRDIHALAKAIGRDHSYVSRIMRLATLAPAVIERVIASQELLPGLNASRARKSVPLLWKEQLREFLGE